MIKPCRIGFLIRSLSRFSPQILAPFSSSSAANPRFSNFSTDEDEFDETDGSAVYRHTLLTQRPSTVEWTPNLVNSISFIGTVDRCPIIYRNVGGNFGCYTMLYARNPHDSNRCFRIQVETWGKMAKMCVQLLKPNDYIYVSGHLESYSKVDRTGNPMSRYKIIANELHYIAQHNQRPDSQSPEEPESGTCQNQEESESEARQSPEESELEARQSLEESELEACQNPEESNLETCQKFKETEPDACQKYIEPHSGAETGMEKDKSDLCLWKVFFSSPDEWWDNRKNKKIPELPDFKHKTSGYALWLSPNDPPWIKRKLQFLDWKMGEHCEEDRHKNRLYLWQVFFTSPHEWWDNRNNKKNPRSPDFKHKDTGEALWLSPNDPLWVKRQIQLLDLNMAVECPERGVGSRSRISPWVYDC